MASTDNLADVAATFMEHLCTCSAHGYSWGERWGAEWRGICYVDCGDHTGIFWKGDRDCSSACIDAWAEALRDTPYEGILSGANSTHDMREVFLASGLFEWMPMSFIAQRGDVYLWIGDAATGSGHAAMCTSAVPDLLAEFVHNEHGTCYGGESGDQTGDESRIVPYWDCNFEGILHYVGSSGGGCSALVEEPEDAGGDVDIDALALAVINGDYGNGQERRDRLGDLYSVVQARVNEMLA